MEISDNVCGILFYKTNIKKNSHWHYDIKEGGAIVVKGIHSCEEDLIDWVPIEVVKRMNEYSDIFDYSISNDGWIIGRRRK